jgi:hypothetical protein
MGLSQRALRPGFLQACYGVMLVMFGIFLTAHHRPPRVVGLLLPVACVLVPRCFFRTPRNGWVRSRQWLYLLSAAGLVGLILDAAVVPASHVSEQAILAVYCGVFLLFGAYDHWLLRQLARARVSEVTDAA